MDTDYERILRMLLLVFVVATACACGKQKHEQANCVGLDSPEKQFVVRVIGIESFTCTFDANSGTIDMSDGSQVIEDEVTPIPEYSIK